jgi:hypothetical protein
MWCTHVSMLDNLLMLHYLSCSLFLEKDVKHHVQHIKEVNKQ